MSIIPGRPGHSIAAVSKLTGVSCHALRVWERRYGFPVPERSPSGHRRYNPEQVSVLRYLAKLAVSGQSIGELIGDYLAGKLALNGESTKGTEPETAWSSLIGRLFEGDLASADLMLDRQAERLTSIELVERVIEPALVDIGERWFRGEWEVFRERCATSHLIARLVRMLDEARRSNRNPSHRVLVGTVQGDQHQGGVLMISLALELAGWRAIPLGVDLPSEQYAGAVETWRPDAVAISFVLSRNINKRFHELSKIRDVPVFVGGRSILNHQGLARRNGLIPLTGSLKVASTQMIGEVESIRRRSGGPAGPGR